jgi:tetratricopeptide (TPR) repeat protein
MLRRSFLVLLLAGCTTSPPPTVRPEAQSVIQAENPGWEKFAEEALKSIPVAEQQKLEEADRHYLLARAWYNWENLDKSKIEAQLAVKIWPEYLEALQLSNDVNEILVGGRTLPQRIDERERGACGITLEHARIEISHHVIKGGRLLDAGMYRQALTELEDAGFMIENLPYVTTMHDLLAKVRDLIAFAKVSIRG